MLLKQSPICRSFVRACLFQPGERQRLDSLVGAVAGDAGSMSILQRAAPVELAVHAASSGSLDRYGSAQSHVLELFVHSVVEGMSSCWACQKLAEQSHAPCRNCNSITAKGSGQGSGLMDR